MSRKYARLRRGFNSIVGRIADEETKKKLHDWRDTIFECIDALKGEAERNQMSNRVSTDYEKRFVKLQFGNKGNIKVTYRPENGECLIKVNDNTPDFKVELLKELGVRIIESIKNDVKLTLRGSAYWSDENQGFRVKLSPNANKSQCVLELAQKFENQIKE